MTHTTRTFFIEKVIPSYSTFVNYYNSRVFSKNVDTFNAGEIAGSLLDIPEHLFNEFGTSITPSYKKLRDQISLAENDYKIVCDLGNVIKHREINFNSPTFTNLDNINEFIALCRFEDDQGVFYKSRKLLEVTLDDGSTVEIGGIIQKSLNVWANYLITHNIIPSFPKLPDLLPFVTSRQDNRFDGKFLVKGLVGEYMKVSPKFLVYKTDIDDLSEVSPSDEFIEELKKLYIFDIAPSPFD
jgi:hypothetical protein